MISREIIWKSLLPFFFTGLKVALPRAVSATIVGEFLVATEGIGHYIEQSRQVSDTVGVFAGIVVATALVLAINAVVNVIGAPGAELAAGRTRNGAVTDEARELCGERQERVRGGDRRRRRHHE